MPSYNFTVTTFTEHVALAWFDYVSLVGYFVLLFGVSFVTARQSNSRQQEKASTEDFFLAERSVSWWAVAASLFASNIGSEHFVGLAGSAAKDGISVSWYEIGAIPVILLLAFVLLPTYLNSAVMTMPDYLEKRYSVRCRSIIVGLSLLLYVFTKVSATLFAGEIIIVELVRVNKYVAVVSLVVCTAFYTITGGLEAVIYTEALQTLVLIAGGLIVFWCTVNACDGWAGMKETLPDHFFHIFRPADDPTYPWTGFVFGYYFVSIWYWGCDQVIVQRALAAKNIAHGQAGCVGASFLKCLPFFLMVIPGLGARTLMSRSNLVDESGVFAPTADGDVDFGFDQSYPWLVKTVVPLNLRGIIIAGVLASLMSSLASVFNSASTIFTLDIWKQRYPETSEKQLVHVGRVTVVVLAILSLAWLPMIPLLGDRLFLIIQKPPAFVAPPVVVVFLWGILFRSPTGRAGEVTLVCGIGLGLARFFLEVVEDLAGHTHDHGALFGFFTSMNFLHFAILNFGFSTALLFGTSVWCHTSRQRVQQGKQLHGNSDSLYFRRGLFLELMTRPHGNDASRHVRLDDGGEVEMLEHHGSDDVDAQRHRECDEILDDFSEIHMDDLSLEDLAAQPTRSDYSAFRPATPSSGLRLTKEEDLASAKRVQWWIQVSGVTSALFFLALVIVLR